MATLYNKEKRSFERYSNYEYSNYKKQKLNRSGLKKALDEIAFTIHEFKEEKIEDHQIIIENCLRNNYAVIDMSLVFVTSLSPILTPIAKTNFGFTHITPLDNKIWVSKINYDLNFWIE